MYSKQCGIQFYKSSCKIYTTYSVYSLNRDDVRLCKEVQFHRGLSVNRRCGRLIHLALEVDIH